SHVRGLSTTCASASTHPIGSSLVSILDLRFWILLSPMTSHEVSHSFGSTVLLHPVKKDAIRFLRRLPEKAMRLSLENFELRARNSFGENFRLRHVIASAAVVVADHH